MRLSRGGSGEVVVGGAVGGFVVVGVVVGGGLPPLCLQRYLPYRLHMGRGRGVVELSRSGGRGVVVGVGGADRVVVFEDWEELEEKLHRGVVVVLVVVLSVIGVVTLWPWCSW